MNYVKLGVLMTTLALLLPVAYASTPREETESYIAVGGDLLLNCAAGRGGACFTLDGSESQAAITIDDDTGFPVGGYFQFQNQWGDAIATGFFCDNTQTSVPSGAAELLVFVDQAFVVLDCPLLGGAPATTGEITVYYT